ncbi:TerC family protein [Ekhidna sp. To15]|uniref:TerC family protein n=1 Tax=Ekhidna sp. To15 TaxID=3395267 RepID=UPI003F5205FB
MLLNIFGGQNEGILFGVFGVIIVLFLIVDLGVFHKKHQKVSQKEALQQSIFWVLVSVGYGTLIYFYGEGPAATLEFFSAYVTEKALSVDNIFVILLILRYFNVKEEYYHNILFWGILGAIVFRAVFIFVGALLIAEFHWILYIFGVFLVYSGIKLFSEEDDMEIEPEKNPLLKAAKKVLPMSTSDKGGKFWLRENGKLLFTPLFLVIILIESTDLIFAVDSIPAAFAITQNEFVIYTSNIFAVMGLRAMFFLLANVLDKFYLLQKGLSIVLIFIGAKMLAEIIDVHVPTYLSFAIIIGALVLAIVLSLIFPKEEEPEIIEEETPAE